MVSASKEKSGGATFWPRQDPRPKYPSFSVWLKHTIIVFTKAPILMGLFCKLVWPSFATVVRKLKGRGWSESKIFMVFACSLHTVLYSACGGFFGLCDYNGWLQQYKMFRKPSQLADKKLRIETIKEAIIGQFFVGPIAAYYGYSLYQKFGMPPLDSKLPSLSKLIGKFVFLHFFNEFFFYWVHRLVHSKPLYKLIHKQHHSYIGTEAIAAEYANPIEQVAANHFPTLGGALLLGVHPLQFFVWLGYRLEETYEAHSGYCFDKTIPHKLGLTHAENCAFHDAHHTDNKGNFGCFTMDWLFGTMDSWVEQGLHEGYVAKTK